MSSYIGKDVARLEDRRFVTGAGTYVADIRLHGLVEAHFVRSVWPHATITHIDASAARSADGVLAVLVAADLKEVVLPFTRPFYSNIDPILEKEYGVRIAPYQAPILADGTVLRVGEPMAMVVAADRYLAEDAAELVDIAVEPLTAVLDPHDAVRADAPLLHEDAQGNILAEFTVNIGDPETAYQAAERHLRQRFRIRRSIGCPIETRGVVARFEAGARRLTVWSNTQTPHVLRSYLAEMLKMREDAVRVIRPDMGGSFGGGIYPEEIAVASAAIILGRPVRWIEDRPEDLANARHSRDQWHDVRIGYNFDGKITTLIDELLVDGGVSSPHNITLSFNTASHIRSQYDIANMRFHARHVTTNKQPLTPVRGAGRTEAAFVMDRIMDMVARDLQIDPAELRLRNLIPATAMPKDMRMYYRNGRRMIYDSGDYPAQLKTALKTIRYSEFRQTQEEARRVGRYLGIGISSHVEGSGYGPYEGAVVRIDGSGKVTVACGSSPHGQSHETVLAQVCGEVLDVQPEDVLVRTGDTSLLPYGVGTFGSRSAVTAGNAVYLAAGKLRDRMIEIAADVLKVGADHLVLDEGRICDSRDVGRSVSFRDLARASIPGSGLTKSPGLEASAYFVPPTVTFASGTHIATVEVDPALARVTVKRYIVVEDCGTVLNPMVVDGQQHGGVAHGIGNALLEEASYDSDGQFTTGSFLDYLLPTATEVPHIDVVHESHPSPLNPLGVKGTGEGGATSPPAAIVNAVADALAPLQLKLSEIPLSPVRLFVALEAAGGLRVAASEGMSRKASLDEEQ